MASKKNLVIVESPAKAKTIGKYLGPDYVVKASMGHLRDLPKSKLGIDIEHDFEPDYKPIRGKEALIRELKEAAKESDTVYLATDPDREGEAISWHLKYLLDLTGDHGLTDDQMKLLRELAQGEKQVDDLIELTQIPTRRVLSALTMLELDGYVAQSGGKRFSIQVELKE